MVAELLCPKCAVAMRVIERNGVTIERCTECGGIFLDRGELERLSQAETAYMRNTAKTQTWDDDDDDDQTSTQRGYTQQQAPPKKKRRGFLDDLFDFG